jgi:hypothetical protein
VTAPAAAEQPQTDSGPRKQSKVPAVGKLVTYGTTDQLTGARLTGAAVVVRSGGANESVQLAPLSSYLLEVSADDVAEVSADDVASA